MFSFFSSFGAASNFEKYRLILTNKNYEAPDQTSLKKIIETFRGEDQQTRSQIAFATIIKKLHTSESNHNWIYLLKNLIIFDRVVEENCFLQQIATLNLRPIENYRQQNQTAKALNSENILKSYWTLIQYKSSLLSQKSYQKGTNYLQVPSSQKRDNSFSKTSNVQLQARVRKSPENSNISGRQNTNDTQRSILSIFRSQKQQFLKTLTIQQIYKQSLQLQQLFENIFKVIASIESNPLTLRKKKSLMIGEEQQLGDKKKACKSSKDFLMSPNIMNRGGKDEQSNGLYENLLPCSSMPDVLKPNNISNQKYKSAREQFFNSKLINYLHLQLLYKLLSTYSNQLICIRTFIAHLIQQTNPAGGSSMLVASIKNIKTFMSQIVSEKQVLMWKKLIVNYLNFSQRIINYVESHKTVKGFQLINYQQLSPFQNYNILGVLDDYIQHKNTLQEPDIVKVEDLGVIMDVNNQIKVDKKAQWSYEKALTARKLVFPTRNLKDKNNAFFNWHNSYSTHFPPKQVLTIDLLMEIRQNPHNPASQDDDDQSIYQPFLVNRHSCIYNFRESNITASSQFQFVSLQEMQKKQQERQQLSMSKKPKKFYYFKAQQKEKQFKNIYSSLSKQSRVWVK